MRILSVDWDFFFPERESDPKQTVEEAFLWDWSHKECKFYIDHVWQGRAAAFLRSGNPLPGMSAERREFWKRFRFSRNCRVYVSESHSSMLEVANREFHDADWSSCTVVSFDAHHDAGYKGEDVLSLAIKNEYDCGNWACAYTANDAKVNVIYPAWKTWARRVEKRTAAKVRRSFDDGRDWKQPFDIIFICRSGAWVPSWTDAEWTEFVEACPVREHSVIMPASDRGFDPAQAALEAERMAVMIRDMEMAIVSSRDVWDRELTSSGSVSEGG